MMKIQSEQTEFPRAGTSTVEPGNGLQNEKEPAGFTLGPQSREERLNRLSPERRALYERVINLRDAIGPIDFDVVEAVRGLRQRD